MPLHMTLRLMVKGGEREGGGLLLFISHLLSPIVIPSVMQEYLQLCGGGARGVIVITEAWKWTRMHKC